jgi:hypothetical protein
MLVGGNRNNKPAAVRTFDGFKTYEEVNVPGYQFVNHKRLKDGPFYIAYDKIYFTKNLGSSWDSSVIDGVYFWDLIDESSAFFVRSVENGATHDLSLNFSGDGLKTFTKITPTGVPADFVKNINSLTAISKTFLYAKSSGKLYASTNGGINWILVEDDYTYAGTPISRVNDSTAFRWIFTRPTPQSIQFELVRTRNRERAACVVDFPMSLNEIPRHMDCVNDSVCFVVTSQGQNYKLWKTTNSGGACKRVLWDSTGTGISEWQAPWLGVKVYPNPGTGLFFASVEEGFTGKLSYSITAIDGRTISRQTISAEDYALAGNLLQINLNGHASGIYLLHLHTGTATAVHKLILQR